MSVRNFTIGLLLTTVLSFAICSMLKLFINNFNYIDMTSVSVGFFGILSIFIFLLSLRATNSADKNFFMYVIFINVMVKIVLSLIIVAIYVRITNPSDNLFILPFLIVYVLFTIFETYFLSCQARITK